MPLLVPQPATRPATQINKITHLLTQNTKRFTQADKSNTKAHTLMVKFILAIYSNIC